MRGEAFGPGKTHCPSVGECQDRKVGVGGLGSRVRRNEIRGFQRGNRERG